MTLCRCQGKKARLNQEALSRPFARRWTPIIPRPTASKTPLVGSGVDVRAVTPSTGVLKVSVKLGSIFPVKGLKPIQYVPGDRFGDVRLPAKPSTEFSIIEAWSVHPLAV